MQIQNEGDDGWDSWGEGELPAGLLYVADGLTGRLALHEKTEGEAKGTGKIQNWKKTSKSKG